MISWTQPRDELLNEYVARFRWSTGKTTLTLEQMDTKHCFNVMKMCWNHLAKVHNLTVVPPFTPYDQYLLIAKDHPDILVRTIITLIRVIEIRGDLTPRNEMAFRYIKKQWMQLETKAAQAPATPQGARAINLTENI